MWTIEGCSSDGILDMLSSFIDLEGLAEQAAKESGVATKPVDTTYPLASVEMDALLQLYRDCRTEQSTAMRTWCTGSDARSFDAERDNEDLCPRGILTHPCSGRVLDANTSAGEGGIEFLWPWGGLRCDAFTDPTTVTHIYLPGEGLNCELTKLDLSVMVSLEQLDLSRNHLHGAFPDWLGEMTLLRRLNLQDNQLKGDIPSSFADNDALELINLAGNNLTASTLSFFDAFHRLQYLDLSNNMIALEAPKSLFASEFLRTINLSHNAFYGDLPELPIFQYLVSLDLSSNYFTGELAQTISLWGREDPHDPDENSVLTTVDVSNNLFTGDLPAMLNQSSLQRFDVHTNNFSGFLPQFPALLLEHVKSAEFGGNGFMCPIPPAWLPSNLTCICGNVLPGKIGDAVEAAENALSDLLDELHDSISGKSSPDSAVDQLSDLFTSTSFRNALMHQFDHLNLFAGALTFDMVNLTVTKPPFSSTRAKPCNPGTYFSQGEQSSEADRECLPCAVGSFSASSGSLKCDPCPRGTFSALEGLATCESCPVGSDSAPGASSCVACSWFTYECKGFWEDLVVALCIGAGLLRTICKKVRQWSAGDNVQRAQDEGVALMAAVRAHGRTLDQVRYEPMGEVSADTMIGRSHA
ncbi:Tyrosine-protein kinase ephrin type A/B receptor-like [Phytophthora cinnamomi]|uniref:Tyrosine-protein kinase ephrin type A/B receptor-like n=1 Tax=Phytophthora cinnamomi TaxID=4785 RepID=UPI00355A7E19|nr:Tyrosine-protein kinase ephrin type A/B receptor-like [Phytophthora cinnamomi]